MGKSKVQADIFSLGELLVKQLEQEESQSMITKWMAYYIAEKMELAENCSSEQKKNAKKECSDAIMALWSRRQDLPKGIRPLKRFDQLFDTIALLRKKREHPLFFNDQLDLSELESSEWLELIYDIDKGTRTAILVALHEATMEARDSTTNQFIGAAGRSEDDKDIELIEALSSNLPEVNKDDDRQFFSRYNSNDFENQYLKGQLREVKVAKKHLWRIEKILKEKYSKLLKEK